MLTRALPTWKRIQKYRLEVCSGITGQERTRRDKPRKDKIAPTRMRHREILTESGVGNNKKRQDNLDVRLVVGDFRKIWVRFRI